MNLDRWIWSRSSASSSSLSLLFLHSFFSRLQGMKIRTWIFLVSQPNQKSFLRTSLAFDHELIHNIRSTSRSSNRNVDRHFQTIPKEELRNSIYEFRALFLRFFYSISFWSNPRMTLYHLITISINIIQEINCWNWAVSRLF